MTIEEALSGPPTQETRDFLIKYVRELDREELRAFLYSPLWRTWLCQHLKAWLTLCLH